mmetsp:Transcript_30278/g.62912  ORF Transcript_30278/g.62912 Transcript_30278/m.62912 type:complete len:344 (+) Transcript_30278:31-1062(+)
MMGSKSKSKPKSKASKSGPQSSMKPKSSSSTWFYAMAILPLGLLLFASQLLKSALPAPPSDFGSGSMFDHIAPRYDFINRALALNLDMSWRHKLVEVVVGKEGEIFKQGGDDDIRILDLATGTADVAILLGKAASHYTSSTTPSKYKPVIIGLDPSQNMISVGNDKITRHNLSNIVRLGLGDSRKLDDVVDNSFHAATMSFGIRNVPEKEMALCEIHRILKKSGSSLPSKLAIMEFSEPGPDSGVLGLVARFFIRHVVPSLGALLSGAPKEYMHLQKSIKEFPSPEKFVEMMEGLKCPARSPENDELEVHTFGAFRVTEVINLNFGSVQIYVATPILKKYVTE